MVTVLVIAGRGRVFDQVESLGIVYKLLSTLTLLNKNRAVSFPLLVVHVFRGNGR